MHRRLDWTDFLRYENDELFDHTKRCARCTKLELSLYRCSKRHGVYGGIRISRVTTTARIGEIGSPNAEGPRSILVANLYQAAQRHEYINAEQISKLALKGTAMDSNSLEGVNNKSHHNPSGGFTNPWPSFRNVGILNSLNYARKNWDREGSKVPPQNELYVKVLEERKMAWEKIRNPPKDRIQTTWYLLFCESC